MKISKHFNSTEFSCNCGCKFDAIDENLLFVLECLREHFNAPIIINSGCRCDYWNAHENGARDSQHLYGKAADFVIPGVTSTEVANTLEKWFPNSYGIGRYYTFTHFDVREGKARW